MSEKKIKLLKNKFREYCLENGHPTASEKFNKWVKKIMHRLLINTPNGMEIDHIDNNGLNNQKSNLRIVTHHQNIMNKSKRKNGSSIFRGVGWCKAANKWQARISLNKKEHYIGIFKNEKDAAKAYNERAIELFGEYANLNEV